MLKFISIFKKNIPSVLLKMSKSLKFIFFKIFVIFWKMNPLKTMALIQTFRNLQWTFLFTLKKLKIQKFNQLENLQWIQLPQFLQTSNFPRNFPLQFASKHKPSHQPTSSASQIYFKSTWCLIRLQLIHEFLSRPLLWIITLVCHIRST